METSPKRGLSRQRVGLRLDLHTRIPTLESILPVLIDDLKTYLEEQASACLRPAHLLFLDKAFADDLVDGGLDKCGCVRFQNTLGKGLLIGYANAPT